MPTTVKIRMLKTASFEHGTYVAERVYVVEWRLAEQLIAAKAAVSLELEPAVETTAIDTGSVETAAHGRRAPVPAKLPTKGKGGGRGDIAIPQPPKVDPTPLPSE